MNPADSDVLAGERERDQYVRPITEPGKLRVLEGDPDDWCCWVVLVVGEIRRGKLRSVGG